MVQRPASGAGSTTRRRASHRARLREGSRLRRVSDSSEVLEQRDRKPASEVVGDNGPQRHVGEVHGDDRRMDVIALQVRLVACGLGDLAAYRAEKSGALVQDVVPVPGRERFSGNAGSALLTFHNENAFSSPAAPQPP